MASHGNAAKLALAAILLGFCGAGFGSPTPTPWPEQFHALLLQNASGKLSTVDLWYDFPNGRNFNIIHSQLGSTLYDLEWTNGTSFFYDLDAGSCRTVHVPVGILPPDWLVGNSTYIGVREVGGFTCNVWSKADDFIFYYEDVETKRPVYWIFYTGREEYVMTFEPGKVLEDEGWQAPWYCFDREENKSFQENGGDTKEPSELFKHSTLGKKLGKNLV
ncbi:hypothetical protein SELMODRAFT_83843 [Selaginella moellendorffii]|uniref:Uncharacterized protein n=2 Tax=Selaginella moellendorffii TaxID=88036 RepID=D8R308_SELML|nr:hypothetical protein SELMODRAFT_83843 [Selaginella moellendorffii]